MAEHDEQEQRQAWDDVGNHFGRLTARFKERYDEHGGREAAEVENELKGALHSVIDAVDRAAAAIGDVARDPATKEDAKATVTALRDALVLSFSQLSDEVRGWFEEGSPPPEEGEWEPVEGSSPRPSDELDQLRPDAASEEE